ncbi:DUF1499 domain-containing protein [Pelagovum pacificum]|uniref:DUF1499 domain-containing protein n=1 Tax=Pelagovum pacificum TaxID=2588711 RepID=A0A5C5GEM9_9RHOB|nr:DUF1499 domain-containing protein [Pelagovum pacificum]QQA44484.1 DUF1499 domain-containing protein [Pelagovum pacificum]TNY32401.1 DUF1499 domain-containing protein [Pelagovum pacificum]
MRYILILILLAIVGLFAWVRMAPVDAARWHVDPTGAEPSRMNGWLLLPDGGDEAAPFWVATEEELLTALDEIALATPRTTRVAGSVADGRITYETRTRFAGFPDYTTVEATGAEGGATLLVYARAQYGKGDWGVNRARVEGWVARLDDRFEQVAAPEAPPEDE